MKEINAGISQPNIEEIKCLIAKAGPTGVIEASDLANTFGLDVVKLAEDADKEHLRQFDTITDAEKIASFNRLYEACNECLSHLRREGEPQHHYEMTLVEHLMKEMLGDKVLLVWDRYLFAPNEGLSRKFQENDGQE